MQKQTQEQTIRVSSDGAFSATVRRSVLCSASAVLSGFMTSEVTDGADDAITLTGASDAAVETFVRLAHMAAHDCGDALALYCPSITEQFSDDLIMLVHKYEAYGILEFIKFMLQREPRVASVVRVAAMFPDDLDWITPNVFTGLIEHYCSPSVSKQRALQSLSDMPHNLIARIVLFYAYAEQRNMLDKIHVFRPALDDFFGT